MEVHTVGFHNTFLLKPTRFIRKIDVNKNFFMLEINLKYKNPL